ncbi:hypothetical protein ABPG72_009554 [Tetrahymena utriculariae]
MMIRSVYILVLGVLFAETLADGFSRVSHNLFFKQQRYRDILGGQSSSLVLLNTFMGKVKQDSKQNIGIIISDQPNYDLCDHQNLDKWKQDYIQSVQNIEIYLLIKITGECLFGSQVREAILLGAKGVILYDPIGSITNNPYPQINVDHIDIPVLIISDKVLGEKLYDQMKKDDFEGSVIICQLNFAPIQQQAFPKVQYFFSSVQKHSYAFIDALYNFIREYDPNQSVSIVVTPQIYNSTEASKVCQTESCLDHTQREIITNGCFSYGKYCTIHNVNYFNPTDVLEHELFQYILSTQNTFEWTLYMKEFIQNCVQQAEKFLLHIDLSECGENILKKQNQPLLSQVQRIVRESWLQGSDKQEIDYQAMDNTSFRSIKKNIDNNRIYQWPTIIVNGELFQENIVNVKNQLARVLCKSMLYPSKQCISLLQIGVQNDEFEENDQGDNYTSKNAGKAIRPKKKPSISKGVAITLSLIGGMLIGGLIFYLVRRNHIREMNRQLDKKVKQAVQKYQKFNEVNNYFQELS